MKDLQHISQQVEYLFFWGHTPKAPGVIDISCLSQWFPASFAVDGIVYPTAEHWMMAQKAKLFDDEDAYARILQAEKPAVAKAIGREVKNFDAPAWQQQAFQIVVDGSFYKFSQNESLKTFLLQTGNKVLVEASPFDKIWGIGMAKSHKDINDPKKWKGTNWLGFALMEARTLLKNAGS
jgi:ribA/ribD-fused uncharacterized protein